MTLLEKSCDIVWEISKPGRPSKRLKDQEENMLYYEASFQFRLKDETAGDALKETLAGRLSRINEMNNARIREGRMAIIYAMEKGKVYAVMSFDMDDDDEMSVTDENGTFVTANDKSARNLAGMIEKYHNDTLFFLFEKDNNNDFGREVVSRLENGPDLIELKEGRGNEAEARSYMERLIRKSRFALLYDEDAFRYLKKKKSYHASEVEEAFVEWSKNCLKEKAYTSYSHLKIARKKRKRREKKDAYQELQNMAGLPRVKEVADGILAFYRIQKIRDQYRMENKCISRHMVFTGNPGSAKTTVARLLSQILLEEGIINTGAFVECGRADLVGKYVGWTAKEVKAKFKKAAGGILFIDEAYALVDESRSFGDEAINTIVREMENHRDDVTVIFAGYPGPMKEFLLRNDGLRSRIAFHLDFPDYGEEELMKILSLMLKEKGYQADRDAMEKCREIFHKAVRIENFGNGRYVRNLLEQAILRQAKRLSGKGGREHPSKESVMKLTSEDFDEGLLTDRDEAGKIRIGFRL